MATVCLSLSVAANILNPHSRKRKTAKELVYSTRGNVSSSGSQILVPKSHQGWKWSEKDNEKQTNECLDRHLRFLDPWTAAYGPLWFTAYWNPCSSTYVYCLNKLTYFFKIWNCIEICTIFTCGNVWLGILFRLVC